MRQCVASFIYSSQPWFFFFANIYESKDIVFQNGLETVFKLAGSMGCPDFVHLNI